MNYNTFVAIISKRENVKLREAMGILEELYAQINNGEDAIDEYCKIYDLIDLILQQKTFEGDDSDFHNLAVVCALYEDYEIACQILDKGLTIYPYCNDLLADYLNYGMRCGRKEQCIIAYEKLQTIKDKWSWRAYLFSIDYLKCLSSIDGTNRDEIIEGLIREFQKKQPEREEAYLAEAEYLFEKNKITSKSEDDRSFVSVLEYATSEKCPTKRTPKCDLKLADYYFENGIQLDKAIKLLDRCRKNSSKVQQSINRKYVYLLLALSYMNQFYEIKGNLDINEELIESTIMNVYENYHKAAIGSSDSRVRGCKQLIEVFVIESGIAYPYDDNIANYS